MTDADRINLIRAALETFISAIDATGGVTYQSTGPAPVADTTWTDLGDAYIFACAALGREVKIYEKVDDVDHHIRMAQLEITDIHGCVANPSSQFNREFAGTPLAKMLEDPEKARELQDWVDSLPEPEEGR